jgi:tetratricopeptide (TPR) repeat protein
MNRFLVFIGIGLLFLIISGCGGDENSPILNADALISQGWIEYDAGNYEAAIYRHQSALNKDPEKAEAYNGIGWAYTKLGKVNDSIDNFKKSALKDPSNADAYAGLAGAYFIAGNYEQAIASAKLVLSLKTNYESPHDPIKANNIRILLAESYYNMGDYPSAKAQIELIGTYGKVLDPSSPSYPLDLLFAIDELAKKN